MALKITAAAEDMEGKLDQEDEAIAAINEKFDALAEQLKKACDQASSDILELVADTNSDLLIMQGDMQERVSLSYKLQSATMAEASAKRSLFEKLNSHYNKTNKTIDAYRTAESQQLENIFKQQCTIVHLKYHRYLAKLDVKRRKELAAIEQSRQPAAPAPAPVLVVPESLRLSPIKKAATSAPALTPPITKAKSQKQELSPAPKPIETRQSQQSIANQESSSWKWGLPLLICCTGACFYLLMKFGKKSSIL